MTEVGVSSQKHFGDTNFLKVKVRVPAKVLKTENGRSRESERLSPSRMHDIGGASETEGNSAAQLIRELDQISDKVNLSYNFLRLEFAKDAHLNLK